MRQLIATEDGLSLRDGAVVVFQFKWNDVVRIEAYKLDLLATDMICLGFTLRQSQATCEIDEEMVGFHDVLKQLDLYFPTITKDWWDSVAHPAFATNLRVLYERPAA